MENDSGSRSDGVAGCAVDERVFDPQGDGQIRAAAPERAFRLIEELGCRRIRDRVDPGLSQNPSRQVGPVDIQKGSDLPGIGFAGWAVTDNQELIRQEVMDSWFMGAG